VVKWLAILGFVGALVWLAVLVLQALLAALVPVLVTVAVVVLILVAAASLSGGRRTGGFSGTWWTH
ncbi:MAG: hypothetical protein ACREX8_02945, partial [Gammaproteobacteria bacterium]